jgi:hypothetical protein
MWIDEIEDNLDDFFGRATKPILIVALVSTLLTNTAVHQFVGVYNLNILPEGTYCFYVEASQYGGKVYTVPAEVRVEKETDESDDKRRTYTYYYIDRFFFSNGNEIKLVALDSVEINKSDYHIDSNGKEWDITLLNKHAYSPHVKETNYTDWLGITILAIEVIPLLFFLIIFFRKEKNNEQ